MQVPVTIKSVQLEMARRITALDATQFNQRAAAQPASTWSLSNDPLSIVNDSALLAHLLFSTSVEDAPNTGLDRDAWGEQTLLALDARVLFSYNLRAGKKTADQLDSSEAAADIVAALLAPWPEVNVELANAYRPGRVLDGRWLEVEVRFVIYIDLSV